MLIGEFVNADEIARGMSPNDVESAALPAARAMLERLGNLLQQDKSFAFETTLSGRGHMAMLKRAQAAGWQVSLLYLWLASPELAQDRVARRVARGGHDIPESVIARRYHKGVVNMRDHYLPLSDVAHIYDNSDEDRILIAEKARENGLVIHDARRWALIQDASE
jgi:predicted ABC-type ATPase